MSVKKGELVHVLWYDAETINEWTDEDADIVTDHSTSICETVGYLVKSATKKDPYYVVASSRSLDSHKKYEYNAVTKIPKGFVKEIKPV